MQQSLSYCEYVAQLDKSNVHRIYHDTQYGFPVDTDDELFERLILEINQAGLSWTTILNKKENFNKSYSSFSVQEVANYKEKDIKRLLNDSGIIRNKLKINAAIFNAIKILEIQKQHGSFKQFLNNYHHIGLEDWVKLFRKNFKFTGYEIVKEFLMSTGYLGGAHIKTCCIYKKLKNKSPIRSKSI